MLTVAADGTVRFRESKNQQPGSMQLKYNLKSQKSLTVSKSLLKVSNSLTKSQKYTTVTPQNVIIAAKCNTDAKCNNNRRKM